jgi:hypothetical protein
MKHVAFLIFLLTILSTLSFAQVGTSFGVGVNAAFPASDFGDFVATGYGAEGMVKFGLVPLIDVTGGLEYIKFTSKDLTIATVTGEGDGSAWGWMIGGRVNVAPFIYGGLEFGSYTFNTTILNVDYDVTHGFIAPLVGVSISPFDISARYVAAGSDQSFVSLRGMVWF